MEYSISDEMIEMTAVLSKLALSEEEKEMAKKDMQSMLAYIDKLNELDTDGVEPLSQIFPVENVFREDESVNEETDGDILRNAPEENEGFFVVPKTFV